MTCQRDWHNSKEFSDKIEIFDTRWGKPPQEMFTAVRSCAEEKYAKPIFHGLKRKGLVLEEGWRKQGSTHEDLNTCSGSPEYEFDYLFILSAGKYLRKDTNKTAHGYCNLRLTEVRSSVPSLINDIMMDKEVSSEMMMETMKSEG